MIFIDEFVKKENCRRLTFFVSGKYDFQQKLWSSGYINIFDGDWTKSVGEPKYPILDDRLLIVHGKEGWESDHWGAFSCEDGYEAFRMAQISSNDLSSLVNCTIYSVLKTGSRFEFKLLEPVTSEDFAKLSFIPTSKYDLLEMINHINFTNLTGLLRKEFRLNCSGL